MARVIMDDIVKFNMHTTPEGIDAYAHYKEKYTGYVTTTIERIKPETSAGTLFTCGIVEDLNKQYDAAKNSKHAYVIELGGNSVSVSEEAFCTLKALQVEQVSNSEEYSKILGDVFFQVFKSVMVGEAKPTLQKPDFVEEFWENVVYGEVCKFVYSKIGGAK